MSVPHLCAWSRFVCNVRVSCLHACPRVCALSCFYMSLPHVCATFLVLTLSVFRFSLSLSLSPSFSLSLLFSLLLSAHSHTHFLCKYTRNYKHTRTHTHVHGRKHMHTLKHLNTQTHTQTRPYRHTHTRTHTHTHVHAHTDINRHRHRNADRLTLFVLNRCEEGCLAGGPCGILTPDNQVLCLLSMWYAYPR